MEVDGDPHQEKTQEEIVKQEKLLKKRALHAAAQRGYRLKKQEISNYSGSVIVWINEDSDVANLTVEEKYYEPGIKLEDTREFATKEELPLPDSPTAISRVGEDQPGRISPTLFWEEHDEFEPKFAIDEAAEELFRNSTSDLNIVSTNNDQSSSDTQLDGDYCQAFEFSYILPTRGGFISKNNRPRKCPKQSYREYRARQNLPPPKSTRKEFPEIIRQPIKSDLFGSESPGAWERGHIEFCEKFTNNDFGHTCQVCDRLWFKEDLRKASDGHAEILLKILPNFSPNLPTLICCTCKGALDKKEIPKMAAYNGFKYPSKPEHLPELDPISERFVSLKNPFMQIQRLRHVQGQNGIYRQIINVPVASSNMVKEIPRDVDDDHCFNVHIRNKTIHTSSFSQELINKRTIKMWSEYLVKTPLYKLNKVKIKKKFLLDDIGDVKHEIDEVSEEISIDDCITAQQHTLLWNQGSFLSIPYRKNRLPFSGLFNENTYDEELSFPSIYLGQYRSFREEAKVRQFMKADSELRRTDRRGVTPCHLLYLAMKIMRHRVKESLPPASKIIEIDADAIRQRVKSEEFMNSCIQNNRAFLRCIPNSDWYWADKQRDLFAILRQRGKPTAFMTLTANEMGWAGLLQVLYKLRNNGAVISKEAAENLPFIEKSSLINEDPVTCAIYFNKMVDVLINILQIKKPFGPFITTRVVDYFTSMEFGNGSSRVHILLWHDDALKDVVNENYDDAIKLIDSLISVSASQASGHVELQTHKHSSACYESIAPNAQQKCRFGAPFMPCPVNLILTPLELKANDVSNENIEMYKLQYLKLRDNLESIDYTSIDDFYEKNSIDSDQHYVNILRAGIDRVTVFLRREPSEKWIHPFNPFILSVLRSHMDFQLITDEYSCAECVVKCVSNVTRVVGDLRKKIIETMKEHPEFGVAEITREMSVDVLNSVEMTSQEAAWYLLREPLSKSSIKVVYIPTIRPDDRQIGKKNRRQSRKTDEDSTKDNCFDKYEQRSGDLGDITLAQFVASYHTHQVRKKIVKRREPFVIKYRNYDVETDINEYKREMVTLHIPFRNEEEEIIAKENFIKIYDEHEVLILKRRKEFESDFDVRKAVEFCRQLICENEKTKYKKEVKISKRNLRKRKK